MNCKICGAKMKKKKSRTMILYVCPVCGNVIRKPYIKYGRVKG